MSTIPLNNFTNWLAMGERGLSSEAICWRGYHVCPGCRGYGYTEAVA